MTATSDSTEWLARDCEPSYQLSRTTFRETTIFQANEPRPDILFRLSIALDSSSRIIHYIHD